MAYIIGLGSIAMIGMVNISAASGTVVEYVFTGDEADKAGCLERVCAGTHRPRHARGPAHGR